MLESVYTESFVEGAVTQQNFVKAAKIAGHRVLEASTIVDRKDHVDFWVMLDNRMYGVDIKGMKRLQRGGEVQDRYTCVELHGAGEAASGWLYGRAQLVGFETTDSFLLVWRKRLIEFVELMVSPDLVDSSEKAIYKVYSRRGSERISWVETDELRNPWLVFKEIQKQ